MADWEEDLDDFFEENEESKASEETTGLPHFLKTVAHPAFAQIRERLDKHGRELTVRETESSMTVVVRHGGDEEISYRIHGRLFPNGVLPYAEVRFKERKGLKIIRVESMIRSGQPDYKIEDLETKEVIANFLEHYKRAVKPN